MKDHEIVVSNFFEAIKKADHALILSVAVACTSALYLTGDEQALQVPLLNYSVAAKAEATWILIGIYVALGLFCAHATKKAKSALESVQSDATKRAMCMYPSLLIGDGHTKMLAFGLLYGGLSLMAWSVAGAENPLMTAALWALLQLPYRSIEIIGRDMPLVMSDQANVARPREIKISIKAVGAVAVVALAVAVIAMGQYQSQQKHLRKLEFLLRAKAGAVVKIHPGDRGDPVA